MALPYNTDVAAVAPRESSGERMAEVMENRKVRIVLVDDHAVVRAGFKQLIETTDDLEVAGEAGTAADALALVASQPCDVMLLDISLPDASVLDTVAALRRRQSELPILIVSMHPEEQYAVNLLRAGASGFFSKAGSATELLEAIRTVAAGRKYVSTSLAEALALAATGDAPAPPHRQLSNREFQIFVQLAAGKTVTDIADEMCLSVKTISTYRSRIFEKMDFSRNADLTAYALRHNLMN
jgi:two-component system, NarL family, invasion response regulator UvrY